MRLLRIKRALKQSLSGWLAGRGYQIRKIKAFDETDAPSVFEIQRLLAASTGKRPVILDVGANRGETIRRYRSLFPDSEIHAFEPVKDFYLECLRGSPEDAGLVMNNIALGDSEGVAMFHETVGGQSSSLLQKSDLIPFYFSAGDFAEARTYAVQTMTVDAYCRKMKIGEIDILKLDAEGYELNILKGARDFLEAGRIRQIYTEVNFERFWSNGVLYHHLANFLEGYGMDLFALYGIGSGALGASRSGDALFLKSLDKRRLLDEAANSQKHKAPRFRS